MSVRVDFEPVSTIEIELGIDANGAVQRYCQNQCYRLMDKYVPFRAGSGEHLRTKVDLSDPELISYEVDWAHYMYEGKVMAPSYPIKKNGVLVGFYLPKGKRKHYTGEKIKYKTPGTGDHWDKKMINNDMNKLVKNVQKYIERGA